MNSNTGIVMEVKKSHAFIMTSSGEFLKVKIGMVVPSVGEIYSGEIVKETPFYKFIATAASLMFVLLFGGTAYAYYTPTASVRVDINPSIELQVNRWDRIIKTVPLNSDGERVLSEISIKNMSLNDGLNAIVEEAKKDNFINENYTESGKSIKITVEAKNSEKKPDISKFQETAKNKNLNLNIIDVKKDKASKQENIRDDKKTEKEAQESKENKNNPNTPVNDKKSSPSNDKADVKDKKNEKNDKDKKSNSYDNNSNNSIPASYVPNTKGNSEGKEEVKAKEEDSEGGGKEDWSRKKEKDDKDSKNQNNVKHKK